jgi:PAS domain-containing protein
LTVRDTMTNDLNRVDYGDDIPGKARSAAVKALYARWKMLSQLNRLTLTEFLDQPPEQTSRFLLVMRSGDDWLFLHQGRAFRQDLGIDLAGRTVRDLANPVADRMGLLFEQASETGIPIRIVYASLARNAALAWERLILPLPTREPGKPLLLVYSEPVNTVMEVYEHLFTHSSDILIAALPVLAPDGTPVDADVVYWNPRAEAMLTPPAGAKSPYRLRSLTPWFSNDAIFRVLVGEVSPQTRTGRTVVRHDDVDWLLTATWLDQVLLISARSATI